MPDLQRLLEARLRFGHMRMLVELERTGSVRQAAQAMHVTQPAISKALKELERTLGVQLYQRMPHGLVATPEGSVATRWAVAILHELKSLSEQTEAIAQNRRLLVRIGTVPFLSTTLLPIALDELRSQGTQLRMHHVEGRVPDLLELLASGQLDAVLCPYGPDTRVKAAEQDLLYDNLYNEELAIFAAADHPLAKRKRLNWHDLDHADWILPAQPSLLRQLFDETLARQDVSPALPQMETTSLATIISTVTMGLGLGICPTTALRSAEQQDQLRRLALPHKILLPVAFIYRNTAANQPPIQALRSALHAGLHRFARDFAPGAGQSA